MTTKQIYDKVMSLFKKPYIDLRKIHHLKRQGLNPVFIFTELKQEVKKWNIKMILGKQ